MKIINNQLTAEKFTAKELAEIYGTPLYVYEEEKIKQNLARITNAVKYKNKRIHYAMFCNNNTQILELLRKEGAFITATSPGDVFIASKAGFEPKDIIFSGTNLSEEDFLFLKEKGIQTNINSIEELEEFCKLNPGGKTGLRLKLKIKLPKKTGPKANGKESRLGIEEEQLSKVIAVSSRFNVQINGVQIYLGTNIMKTEPFVEALKNLVRIAEKLKTVKYIDLGGAFGVDYSEDQKTFNWAVLGREISKIMKDFSMRQERDIALILEPGRSIIANAGVLLTSTVNIKKGKKTFVGVDTCFAHFMRPFLYGAKHRIIKANQVKSKELFDVDICGNTTLSVDFLGRNRKLPRLEKGDILAILDAGAYGYSLSNQFLSRLRPAEALVSEKSSRIIREREKFSDLL